MATERPAARSHSCPWQDFAREQRGESTADGGSAHGTRACKVQRTEEDGHAARLQALWAAADAADDDGWEGVA